MCQMLGEGKCSLMLIMLLKQMCVSYQIFFVGKEHEYYHMIMKFTLFIFHRGTA
jgi:hypothetical protein